MLAQLRLQKNLVITILFSATAVLIFSYTSFAQPSEPSATANTLKVSPVRSDVSADPGQTKVVKIIITNPSDAEVSVRPIQNDFVAGKEEDGTPDLILEETEYAPSHSLKRFMTPLESLILGPGDSRVVDVTLTIPETAEAGGYFGAIRFAPTSPDTGGQVNMSASVTSLILLTVNGDAKEKLDLTDFLIQRNNRPGILFTNSDGLEVMARFKSDSDIQVGPFGNISVVKGDEIVHEIDFNNKDQRDVVLPDSARRWYIPVDSLEGFGKYTVLATFTYGKTNQTIEATKSFWVIPVWMIATAVIALAVIVTSVIGLILHRRSKKGRGLAV